MKKKVFTLLTLIALFVFSFGEKALANQRGGRIVGGGGGYTAVGVEPLDVPRFTFEASIPIFNHYLRQDSSPEIIYEGVGAGFRFSFEHKSQIYLRGGFFVGAVGLDRRNSTDTLDFTQFNFDGAFGLGLGQGPFSIYPYIGIGMNYLAYEESKAGAYPLDFIYGIFPIGVKLDFRITPMVTIGVDLSALIMFAGEVRLRRSEGTPSLTDQEDDLQSTVGFRLMIPLEIYLTPPHRRVRLALALTFWYEYQKIETKTSNVVIQIPDSIYQNLGVFIGVKLSY